MIDTSEPQGVALLGNEMLQWSDEESARPPAAGVLLEQLVRATVRPGTRVLVAGPHSVELVEAIAGRRVQVTCVLRSMPDARALARHFADRPGVFVACGGADRIPGGGYDTIVALDGLDRLLSADSAELDWQACATHLAGLLATGGALLLGVENDLGTHRLVGLDDPEARRGDAEWRPIHGLDASRPTSPAQLAAALSGIGLAAARSYSAYPTPSHPTVLAAETSWAAGETLATLLTTACAAGHDDQPVLADPRWVVRAAVRGELADRLAPAWIAVYGRGAKLPDVLVAEGGGGWTITYELRSSEGVLHRHVHDREQVAMGNLTRDSARLGADVPIGRTLDEQLREACARADLPLVRELLRDYADWLRKHAGDGSLDGSLVFATADNVVLDATGWAVADPSWSWATPVPFGQVLARSLRRFVTGLLASGQPYPWPSFLDAARLCETLQAMSGHPATGDDVRRGLELEAEIVALQHGVPATEVLERIREPVLSTAMIRGHRALVAAHARLADQLRAANERAEWAHKAVVKWKRAHDVARLERRKAMRQLRRLRARKSNRLTRLATSPSRFLKRR